MSDLPHARLDLAHSGREPNHSLGLIQDFGALIAVTSDLTVTHVSANTAEILEPARPIAIGDRLSDHFTDASLQLLRGKLAEAADTGAVARAFGLALTGTQRLFDCALHPSGRLLVIEVEPHEPASLSHHGTSLRPIAERLERAQSVPELCRQATRHFKRMLDFDRVMVCRFHPDHSGEVVAEARENHLEAYLGLRFPKDDIPVESRRLYLQNPLRLIADVNAAPVPVIAGPGDKGKELDLSMSVLRAGSPIHVEYLQNMGVGASLGISIVIGGKLWGLFACHHYTARRVPHSLRTQAELLARLVALRLELAITRAGCLMTARARALHDRLITRLAGGGSLIKNLSVIADTIGDIIPHDGSSAIVEGLYEARGLAPTEAEFKALMPMLTTGPTSRLVASEAIRELSPEAAAFADRAVGALAIPVSRRPRDYVVLWRRGLPQVVTWGGQPGKSVEAGPLGDRLTPRKSFAAWQESVRGRSAPWTQEELAVAESLRATLLEVILRITDEQMQERAQAQERQELLIAELNHRVRNILTLIRGLVSQSRGEAKDIGQFAELIGGRITALALAHDKLTQEQWSPASLHALIEAEAETYLAGKANRVNIVGHDALIAPAGYTVLALVLHEMMTNSARYGSLCDSNGRLEIGTQIDARGNLEIAWRERGGPPVQAPEHRGFGTMVIEKSIPYELKGEADIRYRLAGLEADFVIPAKLVTERRREIKMEDAGKGLPGQGQGNGARRSLERVLVVEDSMIIAMDTEDNLRRMGVAQVITASSVATALEELEAGPFDLALLDFNLGDESSEKVAEQLTALGTPFWFVTGYGDAIERLANTSADGVLKKPYSMHDLEDVLARFTGG